MTSSDIEAVATINLQYRRAEGEPLVDCCEDMIRVHCGKPIETNCECSCEDY